MNNLVTHILKSEGLIKEPEPEPVRRGRRGKVPKKTSPPFNKEGLEQLIRDIKAGPR
ncbi:hypothetical protein PBPMD00_22 [Pinkberry virus LS07-2018-MD00]|jgi:hypothetical protein|nr:hypothetical protein PBPMD00_22 [Pinkberry virus LS07-2018-MD00]